MFAADDASSLPNHYATHLAAVNQTHQVVSTEDIYSDRGILLFRKGSRVDANAATHLLRHKLTQPLANSVQISHALDEEQLTQRFDALFARYPDLATMNTALDYAQEFQRLTRSRAISPMLLQKLTVMAERLPDEFEQSLFCAWFASLIARQLDLSPERRYAVWLAGLMHDIGYLHIPPELTSHNTDITAEQWRAKQAHAVIGKMILQNTPGIHQETIQAVHEHHERCDGTGYPHGRRAAELSLAGQILAMADTIKTVRFGKLQTQGRHMGDIQPILNMYSNVHFSVIYQATVRILRHCSLNMSKIPPQTDLNDYADALFRRGKALKEAVTILMQRQVFEQIKLVKKTPEAAGLFTVTDRALGLTTRSGLVSDELLTWLEGMTREEVDANVLEELNEIELMQHELGWQLQDAVTTLAISLNDDAFIGTFEYASLQAVIEDVRQCLARMAG